MDNSLIKYHFIGIKGTGMASLASIMKDLGYSVSGSDVEEEYFTSKKLKAKGLKALLFDKSNVTEDKIYIASACYGRENIEVNEVMKKGYPLYYYHEFIEKFFKNKIGISGTHGKTTTTSIISKLFEKEKIAFLIGDGTGEADSNYDYFIFEACEYKNHFLEYNYDYLIINNIDYDHPDFFESMDSVIESFNEAAKRSKYLIVNYDDINSRNIKHDNKLSFGMDENADIVGKIIETHQGGYTIKVSIEGKYYQFYLPFIGKHMIYNFLAALSVYYLVGLDFNDIQDLLLSYIKPSRRMEEYYYYDNVVIDDYAHHPVEIKACIDSIQQKYPNKELVIIFQPHTYSRTLAMKEEFREVFKDVELYLIKTFTSKREGSDKELDKEVFNVFSNAKMFREEDLKTIKKMSNKVILFLGAGNLDRYIKNIIG